MSEVIYYNGEMKGVKPEEWDEALDLIFDFQNAELTLEDKEKGLIDFQVGDGWRGGGLSCEEIIQEHFKEFCIKHPHIELRVTAQYVEHAPIEEFIFKGEETETKMLL